MATGSNAGRRSGHAFRFAGRFLTLAPVLIAALLSAASASAAHPGHGSDVLTGTLMSAAEDAITIEFRDLATTQLRRVRILVNEDTKYRVGKEPIDAPKSMIGAHAAAIVDYEESPTGEVIYRATEVRFRKPKKKD
jgi:hypothetical protein